ANAYLPDGTLVEQRVFNRDGSRIVSEFNVPGGPGDWDERHTVVMADGRKVTFETTGDIQRIYDAGGHLLSASVWTKEGPQPRPVQLAFAGGVIGTAAREASRVVIAFVAAAAAALYRWLSSRNAPDRTVVLSLPTTEYQRSPAGKLERIWVGPLTDDQLEA